MKKISISTQWAPLCCMPGCNKRVSFHKRYAKQNGTGTGYKWMQACRTHRTIKKSQFDMFKMKNGCENKDGHHGFTCTATITCPSQIDIHHKDGNKHNNVETNLECLCRNCHGRVTVEHGDHLTRYDNRVQLNPALWDNID